MEEIPQTTWDVKKPVRNAMSHEIFTISTGDRRISVYDYRVLKGGGVQGEGVTGEP